MRKPFLLIPLFSCLTFSSCKYSPSWIKYRNKYSATSFVVNSSKNNGSIKFKTFDGRYVLNLKKISKGEADISYTAKLESGSLKVMYVYVGVECPLFTINGGEELNDKNGYLDGNATYYFIIDSLEPCKNGEITITIN